MINALSQKGVIRTREYKRSDNKIKKKVSKEAEEILCKKAVSCLSIKRSYSMSDLTADMKTESEDIRQRSAELWNCVRRKPNKLGGYIYTFAMPEPKTEAELYTLHDKLDQIYPAVEPFEGVDEEAHYPIQIPLGYSFKSKNGMMYFYIPDKKALLANWKKLQETRPELPPIDIISSEGIASDLEYVESYMAHDALLSSGKEFLHDSLTHVLPTLNTIDALSRAAKGKSRTSYAKEKARVANMLYKRYRLFMIAKDAMKNDILVDKLFFLLGFLADNIAASANLQHVGEHFDFKVVTHRIWDAPKDYNEAFLKRRWKMSPISNVRYPIIEERLERMEINFLLQRGKKP